MHSQFLDLTPENLHEHRNRSEQNWSRFLSDPKVPISLRPMIYESWSRCLREGIDPLSKETRVSLPSDEVQTIFQRSQLYEYAMPTISQLTMQARQTGYIITMSDCLGRLIYLDGDHQALHQAETMNFTLGADWSEQAIGTNAIGTSLAIGEPLQVFAAEHFCSGVHEWVCSCAPIRDPLTQDILGTIDVTGPWQRAQSHTLGLISAAAKVIEDNVYSESLRQRLQLLNEYSTKCKRFYSDGVLVFDTRFHLIEYNYAAQEMIIRKTGMHLTDILKRHTWHSLILEHAPISTKQSYSVYLDGLDEFVEVYRITHMNQRLGFIIVISHAQAITKPNTHTKGPWSRIIGCSPAIKSAINQCDVVAQTNVPILLQGESGTGKELFAHAIHDASPQNAGPFVAVNCGAIPRELLASELFGYEPGSFTGGAKDGRKGKFEEAQNGTLFLDEIGEMPLDAQVYLLRVLQEQEVTRLGSSRKIPLKVRIIAATNKSLHEQVSSKTFRTDLYYRLSVVSVTIPPLRERQDDIAILSLYLIAQLANKHHLPIPEIGPEMINHLKDSYRWPGNIRELQNTLEHAVIFCRNGRITDNDLPSSTASDIVNSDKHKNLFIPSVSSSSDPLFPTQDEDLSQLFQAVNGNISELSRRLGVARSTVYRRLRKIGLIDPQ